MGREDGGPNSETAARRRRRPPTPGSLGRPDHDPAERRQPQDKPGEAGRLPPSDERRPQGAFGARGQTTNPPRVRARHGQTRQPPHDAPEVLEDQITIRLRDANARTNPARPGAGCLPTSEGRRALSAREAKQKIQRASGSATAKQKSRASTATPYSRHASRATSPSEA